MLRELSKIDKMEAVKPFGVENVSKAETFQIGEMSLNNWVDMEEDFEVTGKVDVRAECVCC